MYMGILLACRSVYCVRACCLQRSEWGITSPGTGITGGSELLYIWVLGMKHWSSARAGSALNH